MTINIEGGPKKNSQDHKNDGFKNKNEDYIIKSRNRDIVDLEIEMNCKRLREKDVVRSTFREGKWEQRKEIKERK